MTGAQGGGGGGGGGGGKTSPTRRSTRQGGAAGGVRAAVVAHEEEVRTVRSTVAARRIPKRDAQHVHAFFYPFKRWEKRRRGRVELGIE